MKTPETESTGVEPKLEPSDWIDWIIWAGITVTVGTLFLAPIYLLPQLWQALPTLLESERAKVTTEFVCVALGWCFYKFHKWKPRDYAVVELNIAAWAAYRSASALVEKGGNRWTFFLAFMASVYVAKRAFDNLDKANADARK